MVMLNKLVVVVAVAVAVKWLLVITETFLKNPANFSRTHVRIA